MESWITQHGILPRLHLSYSEEHDARLYALSRRLDKERDDLLREALGDLLARYEGRALGCMLATRPASDEERPLTHARLITAPLDQPLCGAADGPWEARTFAFHRLTCPECKDLVLNS